MTLSGPAQAELLKIGAIVLLGAVLIYGADVVAKKLGEVLTNAKDAAAGALSGAADSVSNVLKSPFTPADQPWTTDSTSAEWTHVQTQGFDILTQYPQRISQTRLDLFATADP